MKYSIQVFDKDNETLLYDVGVENLFSALSLIVSGRYPNCNLQKKIDEYVNMQIGCKNGKTYGLD